MRRIASFVALDALITVPFIGSFIYSFFFGSYDRGEWFWWAFVAFLGSVMLPSAAFVVRKQLPRWFATGLICAYVLMLPILYYGLLYKLRTGAFNVAIYCLLIVTVAKSIYAAITVMKAYEA